MNKKIYVIFNFTLLLLIITGYSGNSNNTYSYKGDTTFVKTGIASYKYVKDHNGNII